MSYYFNDLMSNQLKLIDEKVQHDGLILLVFVSKNCGPLPSFYPFFYLNLKNSTFIDLLRKILTNKVTLKKIQHKEDALGIN